MFGQAVVNDLLPWIDQKYRTLPDRAYRAVGGLSRGASWALHLGLINWELFSIIGMHSLPIFWTDGHRISGWLDEIPPEDVPRIYIDVGTNDYEEIKNSATWLGELLDQKDITHEWYMFPGRHEEAYWSGHVEQYLRFYARDW
jgi:enterochelin esterase-like enzyme